MRSIETNLSPWLALHSPCIARDGAHSCPCRGAAFLGAYGLHFTKNLSQCFILLDCVILEFYEDTTVLHTGFDGKKLKTLRSDVFQDLLQTINEIIFAKYADIVAKAARNINARLFAAID